MCYNDSKVISYENCLYQILSKRKQKDKCESREFGYFQIDKSNFEIFENMVVFDSVFTGKLLIKDSGAIDSEQKEMENFAFNMDQVVSIEPCKFGHEIDDPVWLDVIKKIESEGIDLKLKHWKYEQSCPCIWL